jgi:hypothetical protein
VLLLYSSAATSVNYENEKDANSTGNGHVTASQQPATNPEQQTGDGVHFEQMKPPDALSVGSSVNYFVPSDSDVEDDFQDAMAGALAPSKIPK